MKTYVILLRGVMPIGKNKVPMAPLREVLAGNGFENVRTYIQSGNVLVDTDLSAGAVEQRVHDLIKEHVGPDLVVIARTGAQLQRVLAANPFTQGYDISRVFFVSFKASPQTQAVTELLAMDFSPEQIAITRNAGYLYIPGSAARSKLSNGLLEKRLGVSATTRNGNTLNRLIALSNERRRL
ncbi:MAG: DUF1697 domain-containing protein [Chloroflexi bacterium]|nr:DUF1697 domain-containing protein [Chloroflexota bacterium]